MHVPNLKETMTMQMENSATIRLLCTNCGNRSHLEFTWKDHPVDYADVTRTWYQSQQDEINEIENTKSPNQQQSVIVRNRKTFLQSSLDCGRTQFCKINHQNAERVLISMEVQISHKGEATHSWLVENRQEDGFWTQERF